GLATSSGQGTATITAASASITSSTTISVAQATISSIAVTPSSTSIRSEYTQQFTAIATYSDGSSQDITQSATWISSSPEIASVNFTGLATGMLAGTTTVSASSGSVTGSTSLTVSTTQSANPNAPLFGLHIQSISTPLPTIGFNEVRLWSDVSSTRWAQINKSKGAYNFSTVDSFLAEFYGAGITDVVYTFGQVPKWASRNPSDSACDFATSSSLYGGCDLPTDINIDGTGTDQTFINFVTAIATHVNDPTYLMTHAHIRYWEPWNEWYRNNVVNTHTWVNYSVRASYAQMVRMVEDVRCTITGTGTVNGIPCTATPIDPTAQIVSPSDGANSCCSSPQVFQNFLYCNGTGANAPISGSYCTTGSAGSAAVDIINSHWYEGQGREPEELITDVPVYTSVLSSTDLSKPLWSDEGSWNDDTYVPDPDIQASWVARYYLVGWSTKLVRIYWYAYDSTLYGTLWTSTDGPDPAGQAYSTVYNWVVGSTLTIPCAKSSGTIWTCGIKLANGISAEAIWDTSQTCSDGSCTTRNQNVSSSWTSYQDLNGTDHAVTTIGSVPVGIQPILLTSSSIP
ncbi:MAG: Ig-like domain-containing protein, partial [Candidatus Sulfotelmatobacter sp.]